MRGEENRSGALHAPWNSAESLRRPPEPGDDPQPQTLQNFSPGDLFADYTLRQFCGRGAYGEVYLAEDLSGKTVAIKIIPILPGDDTWNLELIGLRYFRQNVDHHPALVNIYHVGETGNCFYYTMEPADNLASNSGEYLADTLAERISRGPLPPRRILQVAHAMLDALEVLNRHRLIHRDLKPGNILFVRGRPKLSDVGLMTRMDGEIGRYGTLDYLPPEVARGKASGNAGNDLYALGKVLYCCLTGLPPARYPEIPLSTSIAAWRQLRPVIQQACSDNPAERFYSPADFRAELPRTIRPQRWYDRFSELLRRQKEKHPHLFRTSLASLLLGCSALALGFALLLHSEYRRQQRSRQRIDYVFSVIRDFNDRHPHLTRCADAFGRRAWLRRMERLTESAVQFRARNQLEAAEACCKQVQQQLRLGTAADLLRLRQQHPFPAHPETLPLDRLRRTLDAYLQFREYPGFRQLPEPVMIQFNQEIDALQSLLTRRSLGPVPGRDYFPGRDLRLQMVYVAPGLLPEEPRRAYWIAANELTVHSCAGLLPRHSFSGSDPQLPVTGLCWNDCLTVAAVLTRRDRLAGTLPEGYVYRLPTYAEWKFAADGGWRSSPVNGPRSADPDRIAWFAGNSDCRPHPVRLLAPNPLGLYDVFGNAAELTVEDLSAGAPCFGRGGDFRTRSFPAPEPLHYDKAAPLPEWCGVRLVLAPGSEDYFHRQWFSGQARIQCRGGSRFELLGGGGTMLSGREAREWAAMLGGRLAVLKSPESVRRHAVSPNQLTRNACWIGGGTGEAGNWCWADGSPIRNGDWLEPPPSSPDRQFLLLDGEFWRAMPDRPEAAAPLLLVEWPGAADREPEIRPDFRKPPFAETIRVRGREIVLLNGRADWYTFRRVAELLHARLWVPASPEELAEAAAMLRGYRTRRLALGGRHTLDGWFWLDGRMMDAARPDPERPLPEGINLCFAALHQGQLCITGTFDGALLELPEPEKSMASR